MKIPAPVPSEVRLSAVVGLPVVFQHMPLEVISVPPSLVIFPPVDADVVVIFVKAVVVKTGISPFLQE